MGYFEYIMVLISIVVGLGLTHVLGALGTAVHRLRGHGQPIHLDATYLLWVGTVLFWMLTFWWFEFKYQEIEIAWSLGLYLFVTLYAISLYVMAVILVPAGMSGVSDSYEYFMAGRRWFFGAFLMTTAVDTIDTFLKGVDWGTRPTFLIFQAIFLLAAIVGMVSNTRGIQRVNATIAFGAQIVYTFSDLGVLGAF